MSPPSERCRDQVYVWDLFVRLFIGRLVVAFTVAYLITWPRIVHVWAGYVVCILVVARVVWGFGGPVYARFSDFVYSPASGLRYVRDLIGARTTIPRPQPGGGAMVLALLVFLSATVVTGLIVYGGDEQSGPLAGIVSKETGKEVEGVHELVSNITLALILFHIAGVTLASFVHRENLVRAMITGYKRLSRRRPCGRDTTLARPDLAAFDTASTGRRADQIGVTPVLELSASLPTIGGAGRTTNPSSSRQFDSSFRFARKIIQQCRDLILNANAIIHANDT